MLFNPRIHVGCDSVFPRSAIWCVISIHAPVRCDDEQYMAPRVTKISIHTPVRGAIVQKHSIRVCMFQSTHPYGDATKYSLYQRELINFNPRTRVGCDSKSFFYYITIFRFQSAHPCGVRRGFNARFVASLVLAQFQISHCCYRKSIIGPHC